MAHFCGCFQGCFQDVFSCFSPMERSMDRNCQMIRARLTRVASTSEMGKDSHTPSRLKRSVSMSSRGMRNIT